MIEETLLFGRKYSVSGWMVFYRETFINNIHSIINEKKDLVKKNITNFYILDTYSISTNNSIPTDIIELIIKKTII